MAPFEALYGRPCRSLLSWAEIGEIEAFGPDLAREMTKKVRLIR